MLAAAARSCNALDNVEIVEGFAAPLPFEDAAFDGIVSVQVFEYLPDMEAAVAEAARVLRPGGRLVIGDIHWDTLAWHSDRPERMARILHAFDGHFAERRVATLLPPLLARHGLRMQRALPLTFLDAMKRADGISSMMIAFIQAYLRQSSYDDPEELAAWAEEQEALAREGRFYFLLTHVITVAERLPD
jgi:SAM-dependent methyltransferase